MFSFFLSIRLPLHICGKRKIDDAEKNNSIAGQKSLRGPEVMASTVPYCQGTFQKWYFCWCNSSTPKFPMALHCLLHKPHFIDWHLSPGPTILSILLSLNNIPVYPMWKPVQATHWYLHTLHVFISRSFLVPFVLCSASCFCAFPDGPVINDTSLS